ncbi:MAG: chemotaxis protein CheR, partial [Alphaproteobacteria bacterium]|nr:chemotaxis protein CheR [Alphaproteobacteria bacterium]
MMCKEVREMCVFSPHNVLRDPPFSRLDLISCRNLFIYFGAEFQARVLPLFHFALKPSGILFLGTSENVSQHPDLFAALDKKNRMYRRRDGVVMPLKLPRAAASTATTIVPLVQGEPGASLSGLRNAVEARVMEHFSPAHVLVNREGDILFYSARTGKYLEAAAGLPSRQLLVLARRGLRLGLGSALREALETGKRTERDNLAFDVDGHSQAVDLVVEPFAQDD